MGWSIARPMAVCHVTNMATPAQRFNDRCCCQQRQCTQLSDEGTDVRVAAEASFMCPTQLPSVWDWTRWPAFM